MTGLNAGFVSSEGVRLDYLASGTDGPPVLIAPGLSDGAQDYAQVLAALGRRRGVAMSFRGRGRSDLPGTGYDLAEHVGDIGAVVESLRLDEVTLFAHSRAVPYAIAYVAAAPPGQVAHLVLGDNIAVHRSFEPEWIETFAAGIWRGRRVDAQIDPALLVHLQRESRHVDLWDTLAALTIPRTVILAGTHPPERLQQVRARYEAAGTAVVVFTDSGHDLSEPDPARLAGVLADLAGPTQTN